MLHAFADQDYAAPARFRLQSDRRAEATDRQRMAADLRHAVSKELLALAYQPRLSLDTGKVVTVEALVRWPHARRGMVSPSVFIPVAERTPLINEIGAWVMRTACTEAASWAPEVSVSVNVSARQLGDGVLLDQLAQALEVSGLDPERLELELTESMLVEADTETLLTLSAIRDLGVGLALDDYGTGYTSLSVLKRLPLTAMKLDRTLVRQLPADREDAAIARAAVETGHAMDLVIVAEGIETEQQRGFLSGIGCDQGQGFLFSHPVPASSLRPLLPCRM